MSNGAGVGRKFSWRCRPLRAAGDFQRHGAHLFVDEAVGGENDGAAELVWISGKIAHSAAGFFDQQDAGGGVPLLATTFPETLEAAGGDAGKVQRGGAVAAHSVRGLGEVAVVLKIWAGLAVAHGKAGAEQAGRERRVFGDMDFFAVEGGALAARGGEKFVVKGIEDRGGEKRIALGERNRDAETRISVREIRGAVERIDVPAKFRRRSALMPGSFFGGDGVVGKIFGETLDDEAFGPLVRLRDEIHFVAFVSDVQRARQFFDQDFAGFLGDFDGGCEIVLRHRAGPRVVSITPSRGTACCAPTRTAVRNDVFHFTTCDKRSLLDERRYGGGYTHPIRWMYIKRKGLRNG